MNNFIKTYEVRVPNTSESKIPIQKYEAVDVEPQGNTEVDVNEIPAYERMKKQKAFKVDNLFSELITGAQKIQALKNLGVYDVLQNYKQNSSTTLWIGTQNEYEQLEDKEIYEYIILVDDVENN